MRESYKRNLLHRAVRFLIVSERRVEKEKANRFIESCFEILAKQNRIEIVDVASCVQEYW